MVINPVISYVCSLLDQFRQSSAVVEMGTLLSHLFPLKFSDVFFI